MTGISLNQWAMAAAWASPWVVSVRLVVVRLRWTLVPGPGIADQVKRHERAPAVWIDCRDAGALTRQNESMDRQGDVPSRALLGS